MAETPSFQKKQYEFAAHIRDPEHNPAPGNIEDRRMAIYRELFFNNLLKLLSSSFPVLRKIHTREKWRSLIRQFMISHQAQTPYFLEISREFITFLDSGYEGQDDDYPFLLELAHYEWAELALSISEQVNELSEADPEGDLLDGVPVKSSLAWTHAYRFPVHRISKDYRPKEPGEHPTCLCIYRRSDDELSFMELNPVSARLLELIATNDRQQSGRELLLTLAEEMNYPDADALLAHGLEAMEEMRRSEILLGTARSTNN